jgi:hypothetical protein
MRRFVAFGIVVLLVIGVFGLILPAIVMVREAACRMIPVTRLRETGMALAQYHDAYGAFPCGTAPCTELPPEQRLSWLAALLPYLGQQSLANGLDENHGWDRPINHPAVDIPIQTFMVDYRNAPPPRNTPPWTGYVGLAGIGLDAASLAPGDSKIGFFGYERRITRRDVMDGEDNTLVAMSTVLDNGPWAAGGRATVRGLDPGGPPYLGINGQFGSARELAQHWSGKRNLTLTLFADGSVRWMWPSVAPNVLEALVTIAGDENIPLDY